MRQTVYLQDFIEAFEQAGRGTQFSLPALEDLFEYLEDLEQGMGNEIELDVTDLCCDYTEYASIEEFNCEYDTECETIEDIAEITEVIMTRNTEGFIIQQF